MAATVTPVTPPEGGPALPGEALTRRAVIVATASIVAMTFAFSLGNVTRLCLNLGITAWIAWLVAPAVDLSVIGLLTGMRFLSLHGYTDTQLARLQRMLRFCGLLTRTRELNAAHRAATGRPISRDNLRAQLRIGRDRASALVTAVRAEPHQTTEERTLQPMA